MLFILDNPLSNNSSCTLKAYQRQENLQNIFSAQQEHLLLN